MRQDDQVGRGLECQIQAGRAIGRVLHDEPFRPETTLDERGDPRLILDEQDPHGGMLRIGARSRMRVPSRAPIW